MANEENLLKGNPPTEFTSGREAVENGVKGAKASARSKRHKRILSERIKLALSISTQQNLNSLKKEIKEIMPIRHTKEGKEILKVKLAQAKTIQECGIDVFNMIKIAETSLEDEKRIKAINSIWDREDGKPLAKTENKEVKEFSDDVEYLD